MIRRARFAPAAGLAGSLVWLLAAPAFAQTLPQAITLSLPGDVLETGTRSSPATDYRLLTGAWTPDGGPSDRLEGARADSAWRLRSNQQTTLQILAPLREQITQAGYSVLYECDTDACGGFDFRYGLDLLPEPEMHVDLGDFRYLAARRGNDWLALTVSRSSGSGFVHLTTLHQGPVSPANPTPGLPQPTPAPAVAPSDFATEIEADGHVALDDLLFDSGSATLDPGDYASLQALAAYLKTHPKAQITLVGHTDATGALDANIALSKARAGAVLDRLTKTLGVIPEQLSAQGAGWLAPRASNLTETGRARNRRVDAVLDGGP